MKEKILKRINYLLAAIIAILGFNSCERDKEVIYIVEKYGIPYDTVVALYGVMMYGVPDPGYHLLQQDEAPAVDTEITENEINKK